MFHMCGILENGVYVLWQLKIINPFVKTHFIRRSVFSNVSQFKMIEYFLKKYDLQF